MQNKKGELIEVWTVQEMTQGEFLTRGVFPDLASAQEYDKEECKGIPTRTVRRTAFKWDDENSESVRVSLFNEREFGPFELCMDFTQAKMLERQSVLASARAKLAQANLTLEENLALGLRS